MRKQSYHFFLRIKKFPVFCTSYAINVFSQYQTRIIVLLKSNTFHYNFCFLNPKKNTTFVGSFFEVIIMYK